MEPITDTVLWPDGPEVDPPSLPGLLHLSFQHDRAFSDVTFEPHLLILWALCPPLVLYISMGHQDPSLLFYVRHQPGDG